jgi:alkylation response protein AidB-like acyl-CoA dehydrogenase
LRHGNAEKARYPPNIASGKLQAFGVTEPISGTDTLSPRTTAIRDGDHYVVNGQKIWTSRIEHSDLHLREFVDQRHAQLEFQIVAHSAVPSREGEAERIGPQSIGR